MNSKAAVPRAVAAEPLRVLVPGAGVIRSVYAARLIHAGHRVVMLARGQRLAGLHARGLVPESAFAIRHRRRVLASPGGELMFADHSRAAPGENTRLGQELRAAVHWSGRPVPALGALLSPRQPAGRAHDAQGHSRPGCWSPAAADWAAAGAGRRARAGGGGAGGIPLGGGFR